MSLPFMFDADDSETTIATDDPSHLTGNKNSGGALARIPVSTYQWLIVVGALGLLWALYFGFRSDMKG